MTGRSYRRGEHGRSNGRGVLITTRRVLCPFATLPLPVETYREAEGDVSLPRPRPERDSVWLFENPDALELRFSATSTKLTYRIAPGLDPGGHSGSPCTTSRRTDGENRWS
jgi:hypothetical protein